MNKPAELVQLIEDLRAEARTGLVEVGRNSNAIIYVGSDDDEGITLSSEDCRVLFDSVDAIDRLIEALPLADDLSVVFVDVILHDKVRDMVERRFSTVDEG